MKKIIIILAVILTSALTAVSLNRKDNTVVNIKINTEKVNHFNSNGATSETQNLATAD